MDAEREGSQWHCLQAPDVLLGDAGQRARSYLSAIRDRPVAPPPAALAALGRLDFPLPSAGLDPAAVLRMIDEAGSPATVASAGPRYFQPTIRDVSSRPAFPACTHPRSSACRLATLTAGQAIRSFR